MLTRIDWPSIGMDLRKQGFGLTRISVALGLPKSTVQYWFAKDVEPRFMDGHRLLSLWAKVVQGEKVAASFSSIVKRNRRTPVPQSN
jgi:uncharacterized protein Usg